MLTFNKHLSWHPVLQCIFFGGPRQCSFWHPLKVAHPQLKVITRLCLNPTTEK